MFPAVCNVPNCLTCYLPNKCSSCLPGYSFDPNLNCISMTTVSYTIFQTQFSNTRELLFVNNYNFYSLIPQNCTFRNSNPLQRSQLLQLLTSESLCKLPRRIQPQRRELQLRTLVFKNDQLIN